MMLIACPFCGPRGHVEFAYERTLDAVLPLDASPEEAARILYQRANPRGPSSELWRHTYGCRAWMRVDRNTATHEIASVTPWPPASKAAS